MKHEASITPKIIKYIQQKKIYGMVEVKYAKGDTFYFSSFENQQVGSLIAGEMSGLVWKLSDADPRLKPCDIISLPPIDSYVAIKFLKSVIFLRTPFIKRTINMGIKSISAISAREFAVYEFSTG